MVKHTDTIRRLLLTNFLSVFDHFVGMVLKVLRKSVILTEIVALMHECLFKLETCWSVKKYPAKFSVHSVKN